MKKGIKGSTLKIIAIISMLIDHIGASILTAYLTHNGAMAATYGGMASIQELEPSMQKWAILWWVMRMLIGRLAFPIFCYLLIEGFLHTRNVWKYAGRLFLFSLISEVPFDLGFYQTYWFTGHQNVFLTLFIGLMVLVGMQAVSKGSRLGKPVRVILDILIIAAGGYLSLVLRTDYALFGVLFIVLLYVGRKNKPVQITAGCVGCVFLLAEITAPLAFLPIGFYNGERGWKLKYVFYVFYPAHLLILYFICVWTGLV